MAEQITAPNAKAPPPGKGVRTLKLEDQLPDCPVGINQPLYDLAEYARGKRVIDIVIMDSALEHVAYLNGAFREIARILKPGGTFVIRKPEKAAA